MLIPKQPRIESKKLRDAARDQPCVLCLAGPDPTTVLAHLPIASMAGVAQKTDDLIGCHVCATHHAYLDGPEGRQDWRTRFLALARTLHRLQQQGLLIVAK